MPEIADLFSTAAVCFLAQHFLDKVSSSFASALSVIFGFAGCLYLLYGIIDATHIAVITALDWFI